MKSKSDVKSTRNVPPLAPCLPPLDDLLDAGDATPALRSRPAPIAKATTESQTLLFIGLLSMNRGNRFLTGSTESTSSTVRRLGSRLVSGGPRGHGRRAGPTGHRRPFASGRAH